MNSEGRKVQGRLWLSAAAMVVPAPPPPSDVRACRMLGTLQQAVQDLWGGIFSLGCQGRRKQVGAIIF